MHPLLRHLSLVWLVLWLVAPGAELVAQVDPWRECRVRFAEAPSSQAPARCFYTAAANGTDLWSAARHEMEALLRRDPDNPWLLYYLGHVLKNIHWNDPRVHVMYRESADRFTEAGDAWGETLARKALQYWLLIQDRFEEASRQLEMLERSVGHSKDPRIQARLDFCRAQQLFQEGRDWKQASIFLERAEPHLEVPSLLYSLLNNRGAIYLELGQFNKAQKDLERALQMARERNDEHDVATAMINLNYAISERHESDAQEDTRRKILQSTKKFLATTEDLPPSEALAKLHLEVGRLVGSPKGERHFQRCAFMAEHIRRRDVESECLASHARAAARTDPARARDLAQRAREAAEASGDLRAQAFAFSETSHVYWRDGSTRRAFREHLKALDKIEALLAQQTAAQGKAHSFSDWADTYQTLIGYLLKESLESPATSRLEEAFRVSERMHSRVLQEALRRATRGRAAPPRLSQRQEKILQQMQAVNRRLLAAPLGTEERSRWIRELEDLELQLDDVTYQITKSRGRWAPPTRLSFAPLRDVQANLQPDQALLVFQVAPERDLYRRFAGASWVLAVTATTASAYSLPPSRSLSWRVPAVLDLVQQRVVDTDPMIALQEELLQAALADLPNSVTSLILLPDGPLHSMPISMLQSSPEEPPLADRYRIARVPSATLWLKWRQRRIAKSPLPALVLADPKILSQSGGFLGTGPAVRSGGLLRGPALTPLPLARQEGRRILQYLGPTTVLRQGEAATERLIKTTNLQAFQILHFAAHAQADHERPDRAGIHLAPDSTDTDGLLQFREIVDLDLDGRIVVLSACDTATGEILRGEGVLDLARAFFQAGAHAVVASLWPLRDDDGRDFFDAFYRHLAEGESLAGALQGAQIDRIEAGAPAAAWAGIVVVGDGSMVPFPDAQARLPFVSVVLLALGIFGLALVAALVSARANTKNG